MFTAGMVYAGVPGALYGAGQVGRNAELVPVVVAAVDIAPRESITPDLIAMSGLEPIGVPPHAFKSLSAVEGEIAVVPINKGTVITGDLVTGLVATVARPRQVAVSFTITQPADNIAPGDVINVDATINVHLFSPISNRLVTRLVFVGLVVIRVGSGIDSYRRSPVPPLDSSLTVVMNVCDAQYMAWLAQNAVLDYVPSGNLSLPIVPACTATEDVGPAQVNARWHFIAA
jgi:Flp pilus assembly protein CpaB